jgi:dihydropteroate synthase
VNFENKKYIMGILNVTPDSFYDGGRYDNLDDAYLQASKIKDEGADIIDIGGESTRPGAGNISVDEELSRVCPIVEKITKNLDIAISIDTTKSEVAEECLKLGAHIINDISGLSYDEKMAAIVAKYDAGLVLMHIKGDPRNMQQEKNLKYDDLVADICAFLKKVKKKALENGVENDKIILDPGIGFAKSLEDNYRILNNIKKFKELGNKLLIGLSRKSMIGKLYDFDVDRLPATIALNAISLVTGADIVRVHDVKAHRLALDSLEMLQKVK